MLIRLARLSGLALVFAFLAAPASAQIVQSLHINGGVFMPRGYDGRVSGDVLAEDFNSLEFPACTAPSRSSCIGKEFTTGEINGEWLVAFGDHIELGAGVGFYTKGAPTVYADYTNPDNSEIQQHLDLRVVPITGIVRFLGGRPGTFQPYFGVGVAALNYRYTEAGSFIDFTKRLPNGSYPIFNDRFVATGTAPGGLFLAGFRAPVMGDIWGITMEWRYQAGVGKTGGLPNGFLADKIDLGGNHLNFGVIVRF